MQNILLIAGSYLIEFITFLILANVILSWFNPNMENPIIKIIYGLTEPLMAPVRRFATFGPIDFSPVAIVLLLQFVIYPLYKWIVMALF